MNNRVYDRSGIETDGTLSRLNQALSALENRIATSPAAPRFQTQGLDDVNAIRQREAALRSQQAMAPQPQQPSSDFTALRDEIRALRAEPRSNDSGMADLRADIEILKSEVTQLARQDAIADLSDRWGVVEQEIARMPQTLATRDDMSGMAARLDALHQSVTAMPESYETRALEERIHTLAAAMEAFGEQQAGFERSLFSGVDERLSAIDRAISGIAQSESGTDKDALDRIEARIGSLTRQLEEVQSVAAPDYTPVFNEMTQRLNALQDAGGADPAVHEALTLIAERVAELQTTPQVSLEDNGELDALSNRLDHIIDLIQQQPNVVSSAGLSEQSFSDIESRLDVLAQQMSQSAETTGRSVKQAVTSLEARIGDLAAMLDARDASIEPAAATFAPLDSVEERLDDIARFLSQQAEAPSAMMAEPLNTEALEQQIAELTARLSDNTMLTAAVEADGASGVDVMEAARVAAEQVLERANLHGEPSAEIAQLSNDLKALETLARESDGRNERTFEAIHDTLLKIVDHLSDLESSSSHSAAGMAARSDPTPAGFATDEGTQPLGVTDPFSNMAEPAIPPQSGLSAQPATARLPVDDVPPMESPVTDPLARNLTPAQAAASAAIAAMSQTEEASTTSSDPAAGKKSLLQAVTGRFAKGDTPAVAGADSSSMVPPDGSDVPLEPGTAQSEVAEIIARVRREREAGGQVPTSVASSVAPAIGKPDPNASKSDFIAAARRAAQAAASDAQVAETRAAKKETGLKASVAHLLTTKRRPLLIGAAAILVAMLALPLVHGLLGGGSEVAVAPADPAPIELAVEADMPDTGAMVAEGNEFADVEIAPRIIGEDSGLTALPLAPNQADASTSEGFELAPEIAPDAQTITAAIPSDAGTVVMQDAARAGDPKALFLVGDYFAAQAQNGGAGGIDQNNAEALNWYTKSAEAGYAPAQQRLGSLYEKGIGTDRDLQIAKSWYQLAAEQGNAAAKHNLGVLYANGVDGQPDLVQAVSWFEQAALNGIRDSQYNLGVMAVRGDGMEPDLSESFKWFSLAAQSGDADAASKRDTVAERMDPASLQMARDEVALWRAVQPDQVANVVDVPEAWQTDQMRTAAAEPQEPIDIEKAVRNIQAILNANGYDAGPVDGLMGNKTTNAIRSFQADNGLPVTGEVDEQLVRKLLDMAA